MHSSEEFDSFTTLCSKSHSNSVTSVAISSVSDNTAQIQSCEHRRAPHRSHGVTARGPGSPTQLTWCFQREPQIKPDVPAHCRGFGPRWALKVPSNPKHSMTLFYDSKPEVYEIIKSHHHLVKTLKTKNSLS